MKTRFGVSLAAALLAAAISSATSAPASADTLPATAQASWSKFFPGAARIPDPELDIELVLDSPDECRPAQRTVVAQTIAYGRRAYDNDKGAAHKKSGEIQASLHQLEDQGSPCFESVARAYLAASVHLLNPANSNAGYNIDNARIDDRPAPQGLELTLLASALLNHHQADGSPSVQLLTPNRRGDESAIWRQKTGKKGDSYLVSAGYDCVARGILIDPYLPPLNLASIFVHEIDHVFRDRVTLPTTALEDLAKLLRTSPAVDPLADHLLLEITMDETLASVAAADYQRHMRWSFTWKAPRIPWLANSKPRKSIPFLLTDDLSLFRTEKTSPINIIWHLLEVGHPATRNQINPTAAYFLAKSFLLGDIPNQPIEVAMLDAVHRIYQVIYAGYFGGALLSPEDLALLDPRLHGHERDPLAWWLNANIVTIEDDIYHPLAKGLWVREYAKERYNPMFVRAAPITQVGYRISPVLDGLDQAFAQIYGQTDLSPYCQRYLKGLENGELANYVGTVLSTGFKPGETGVKGGETGVKGGETGVKGGETGVKGGETGVKPALIRPCLNIGPEL